MACQAMPNTFYWTLISIISVEILGSNYDKLPLIKSAKHMVPLYHIMYFKFLYRRIHVLVHVHVCCVHIFLSQLIKNRLGKYNAQDLPIKRIINYFIEFDSHTYIKQHHLNYSKSMLRKDTIDGAGIVQLVSVRPLELEVLGLILGDYNVCFEFLLICVA